MTRLAVLNFGGIGDEILFSPVLNAIRADYPNAHITLVLEQRSQSIAPLLPRVDAVKTVTGIHNRIALFVQLLRLLRTGRYNAVISSGSSPFIALLLGVSGIPITVGYATGKLTDRLLTRPALLNTRQYAGNMYVALAEAFLEKSLQKPALPVLHVDETAINPELKAFVNSWPTAHKRIVIHPGVSQLSIQKGIVKSWPLDQWRQLITQLLAEGRAVVLAGGPDDRQTLSDLQAILPDHPLLFNTFGLTRSLNDLGWLLKQTAVLACVDSAPMHLAVALGVPVVCMFGPTNPDKLLPADSPKFKAVYHTDLPCRPCLWHARQTNCETSDCLKVPVAAMAEGIHNILTNE